MYAECMAKKKKKLSTDVNVTAFQILEAISNSPRLIDLTPKTPPKNPAAVALGRLGGLKGGNVGQRTSLRSNGWRLPRKLLMPVGKI